MSIGLPGSPWYVGFADNVLTYKDKQMVSRGVHRPQFVTCLGQSIHRVIEHTRSM